jgi:hypothetical protein
MQANMLHVFTSRFNPLDWKKPHQNYLLFAQHMLDSGVNLVTIECSEGEVPFSCELPGIKHIGVRCKTRGWTKENLLNLAIQRTPEAKYIAWIDADVTFRRKDWAAATVRALQHYDIIQPWKTCYDLGPNDEHIAAHTSFAHQYFYRQPLFPPNAQEPYWQGDGGKHIYPHSGYAWACTRLAYDWVGGLFEVGGMGSGDHHMAMGLVGKAVDTTVPGTNPRYNEEVLRWERRAMTHINGNVGYLEGTIEHMFHGRKKDRGYLTRWEMFLKHGFDPSEDLKRNSYGVLEFATNKPELRHAFDLYLRQRNEDSNTV